MLLLFCTASRAQLARLTSTGEQEYRLNISRGGPRVVTPFSKTIRSYSLGDIVEDGNGGYVKFVVLKGDAGSTKDGAYVHFMKLDKRLTIKSEKEIFLVAEGSENMQPVGGFDNGGQLYLITAGPDKSGDNLNLTFWQFDLATLSLLKSNQLMASMALNKTKEYDFKTIPLENGKGMIMSVLEEGNKKENSVLHSLFFTETLGLQKRQSAVLPFFSSKGRIVRTLVNGNGTLFSLLAYPDQKNEEVLVNSLLVQDDDKSHLVLLPYKDGALINCAIGLSAANDLWLGGLVWPGKKEYCPGFVLAKVSRAGALTVIKEEIFPASLLEALEEADKKGVKRDYYVRSVTERANGVVDLVVNYCKLDGGWTGVDFNKFSSSVKISDAVIFSFDKDKLVSTLSLKRNLDQYSQGISHKVLPESFGIPRVFTEGDDLYLLYFDNPSNAIAGGEAKKPKWADFAHGSLVLARIDKAYKPTQQEVVLFDKDGDFRSFYELSVTDVNPKKYILSTNKYALFSKNVKTVSLLMEMR